jgi:hypothetical protein
MDRSDDDSDEGAHEESEGKDNAGSEGSWETNDEDAQEGKSKVTQGMKARVSNARTSNGTSQNAAGGPSRMAAMLSQMLGGAASGPSANAHNSYVDIDPRGDPSMFLRVVREENPATWKPNIAGLDYGVSRKR